MKYSRPRGWRDTALAITDEPACRLSSEDCLLTRRMEQAVCERNVCPRRMVGGVVIRS